MGDSGSLVEVEEFFAEVTGWCSNPRLVGELRESFLSAGSFDAERSLGAADVLLGLTHALHDAKVGLWLDHGEGDLLERLCADVIDHRVGRPDAYWQDPDSYTDFRWSGSSVEDGLSAFDNWLATVNQVQVRGDASPLRLINIETGHDYYLSVLCPQDVAPKAIERLCGLGLTGSLAADGI